MIPRNPRLMWLSSGSFDTDPIFRNTIDPTCPNTPANASSKSSCVAAGNVNASSRDSGLDTGTSKLVEHCDHVARTRSLSNALEMR